MSVSWRSRAACLGADTNLWFPTTGEAVSAAAAKLVCAGCPVQTECLLDALETDDAVGGGVRGGLSFRERRRFRRVLGLGRRRGAGCGCAVHRDRAA